MKKMSTLLLLCLFLVTAFALSGCESGYSESEMEAATQQAYNQGFDDGYYQGGKDMKEIAAENFLIDGYSIRDIENEVYETYGMTPHEAFVIIDEYTYDSKHGGYTKAEYENAVEIAFYTIACFPYDY